MGWSARQIHVRMEELVRRENYLTRASARSSRLGTTVKVSDSHGYRPLSFSFFPETCTF